MPRAHPPILDRADELLARYDLVFCDVWGVVHDGARAYPQGCAALARFRANGGTVVLVSNAPRDKRAVAGILDEKGVPEDAWDAIVSSGDLAAAHVHARGYARVHHVGPDRDLDLFEVVEAERVALEDCEALLCTGLVDDRNETVDDYRQLLEAARALDLPFVCANPDLVVDVGGTFLLCAGSLAAVYEELGGAVYWAGKPHAPAYETATTVATRLRGAAVPKSRTLAIGDAVRTDLAGARAWGIDSLFIGQGIHRDDILVDGRLDPDRLVDLFAGDAPQPVAAMVGLV